MYESTLKIHKQGPEGMSAFSGILLLSLFLFVLCAAILLFTAFHRYVATKQKSKQRKNRENKTNDKEKENNVGSHGNPDVAMDVAD
jgi:cell division protein FtsB